MSIIDDISNRFFKRESVSSNIKTSNNKVLNRYSLGITGGFVPYAKGLKILEDNQVSTGFDILKYILSSKQWILIANEEDGMDVYDFINNMLLDMETEVNEVVKTSLTALLWGFSIQELIFEINADGKLVFVTGKYKGKLTNDVCKTDKNYINWIFEKFSEVTKRSIMEAWYAEHPRKL